MPSVYSYKSVRKFLKDVFQERMLRNSNYSLRAFARDLGYSSARLSQFLNSNRGLSLKSAHKIAEVLKLTEYEREYFINLAISEFSRSKKYRAEALNKILHGQSEKSYVNIKKDLQSLLGHWYNIAIVELITLKTHPSVEDISRILKITTDEVQNSLEALTRIGILKYDKNKGWVRDLDLVQIKSPAHSQLIRQFFKALIKRSLVEIDRQAVENRKYVGSVISLNKENLAEARRELERLHLDFVSKYSVKTDADAVYCLAFQFYELG